MGAGAAINFVIGSFNVAPVSDARGEVKIVTTVTPGRRATDAQITGLNNAAVLEAKRLADSTNAFLATHARNVNIGPAKQPWHYTFNSSAGRLGSQHNFLVSGGESYTEQSGAILTQLQRMLRAGSVSRTLPGALFGSRQQPT